ncbi:MAG: rod shape-determining protein [Thermoleophilia bacterium]
MDLGTSNTLVRIRGRGLVFAAPSVVAVDDADGALLAVGADAHRMLGRAPDRVRVIEPLHEGVIFDAEAAGALVRHALACHGMAGRIRPDVVVCAPAGITAVERRALEQAVASAGARCTVVMEEPLAGAIGAGLPVSDAGAGVVADIGGGTTEVVVLSLGGIVVRESVRIGGRHMDEAIAAHLARARRLAVGPSSAEALKLAVGSAGGGSGAAEVGGRDLDTGLPRMVRVDAEEIAAALAEPVEEIVAAIGRTLERTPADLAGDVLDRGVTLIGGGSCLHGLDALVMARLGVPVHRPDDPLGCVARGAELALSEMATLRRSSGARTVRRRHVRLARARPPTAWRAASRHTRN